MSTSIWLDTLLLDRVTNGQQPGVDLTPTDLPRLRRARGERRVVLELVRRATETRRSRD